MGCVYKATVGYALSALVGGPASVVCPRRITARGRVPPELLSRLQPKLLRSICSSHRSSQVARAPIAMASRSTTTIRLVRHATAICPPKAYSYALQAPTTRARARHSQPQSQLAHRHAGGRVQQHLLLGRTWLDGKTPALQESTQENTHHPCGNAYLMLAPKAPYEADATRKRAAPPRCRMHTYCSSCLQPWTFPSKQPRRVAFSRPTTTATGND